MTSETQTIQYDENHSIDLSGISSSKSLKTSDSLSAMHVLENTDGKDKKGHLTKENFQIKSIKITNSGQDSVVFTIIMVSFTLFLFNTQINNFDFLL